MKRIHKLALLSTAALVSASWANGFGQVPQLSLAEPDLSATTPSNGLSAVPPLPRGASTNLGGAIRDVDPVLDRFTLKIVGEKPMRILYDERTQIFLDGKRIPLSKLQASEHASVQTTLDGVSVFAISVHILSQLQQGDYRGEVVGYNSQTGDLDLATGKGGAPIRLRVSSDTKFERKGQSGFTSTQSGPSDLAPGAIVAIEFQPDGKGRGAVTHIAVLATPGSKFVFSGNLLTLDVHNGTMMLLDPRDEQSYQIQFDAGALPSIQTIHAGQHVRVTAEYDGSHYLAREVSSE